MVFVIFFGKIINGFVCWVIVVGFSFYELLKLGVKGIDFYVFCLWDKNVSLF